jgi:hypothetical protein
MSLCVFSIDIVGDFNLNRLFSLPPVQDTKGSHVGIGDDLQEAPKWFRCTTSNKKSSDMD